MHFLPRHRQHLDCLRGECASFVVAITANINNINNSSSSSSGSNNKQSKLIAAFK